MMKRLLLFVCVLVTVCASAQVKPGIEVLRDSGFKCLEGKRVGLITNPTGVDNNLQSTVDILFNAPNVNLVALYGPEHGVRGNVHAGDQVGNDKDPSTGLVEYSLYGKNLKPSAEMLKDIDVLVYDIQDVGSRSFTYISTMGVAMEAAAENNIEFVVLDRPNPLGGEKVEGSLVEPDCFSFVSRFAIPYVYGLTCGELAMLLNGEKMLGPSGTQPGTGLSCKLTVVPMEGWSRDMDYPATGLQWIASSPHIPHPYSAYFYPISGIVGELGTISIGVGYTLPFQIFGTEDIAANKLADALNAFALPGVYFRPIYYKPYYAVGSGKQMQGVQVHLTDPAKAPLTAINFIVLEVMHQLKPDWKPFETCDPSRVRMLEKVLGSKAIVQKFAERYCFDDIKDYWNKDVENFKSLSAKYYLY